MNTNKNTNFDIDEYFRSYNSSLPVPEFNDEDSKYEINTILSLAKPKKNTSFFSRIVFALESRYNMISANLVNYFRYNKSAVLYPGLASAAIIIAAIIFITNNNNSIIEKNQIAKENTAIQDSAKEQFVKNNSTLDTVKTMPEKTPSHSKKEGYFEMPYSQLAFSSGSMDLPFIKAKEILEKNAFEVKLSTKYYIEGIASFGKITVRKNMDNIQIIVSDTSSKQLMKIKKDIQKGISKKN